MARRRNLRSISTPIVLGAVSVPLAIALLVGWTLLIAENLTTRTDIALDVWLLVIGAISFVVIAAVLVLFSYYLAREILEVRRQDSFIDSVTHELKSPLASLRLCLETLARPDLPAGTREHLREMMLGDVDRLTSFIDDVLQASRLANMDQVGVNVTEIDFVQLATEVAESVRTRRKLPEGTIRVEAPDGFRIVTDEAALTIVLRNLVDNAVKYSGSEVDVVVRAHRDDRQRGVIEVVDHGIGIDQAHRAAVFQRFYRVQSPEVRERKGTGLGLFVVSALVKNLGGTVEAHSEGLGKGTTMCVVLPNDDEAQSVATEERVDA
ncbi:MAG: HAMP domain-containing histidine kinase [Sandaracinus sp.]|nr:HAMP domain-containing histidine kinase [Sandaracinus sp.]MCB9611182.1 HAMP domain-containing histidine kinase [Sandaracinus sp.]MCB9623731.1 HAMP domain-containing histidine kinase [Sandaracinus sp.]